MSPQFKLLGCSLFCQQKCVPNGPARMEPWHADSTSRTTAASLDRNRYVYAVVSRRARGLSIGVNLNPDKVCNFDCPYCQVDRTTPGASPRIDVGVLAGELELLLERARGDLWGRAPFDSVATRAAPRGGHRVRRRRRADDAARVPRCRARRPRDARPAGCGRAAAPAHERDALPQAEGARRARRVRRALVQARRGNRGLLPAGGRDAAPLPPHPRQPAARRARAADRDPGDAADGRRPGPRRRRGRGVGREDARDRRRRRPDRPRPGLHGRPQALRPALRTARPRAARADRGRGADGRPSTPAFTPEV